MSEQRLTPDLSGRVALVTGAGVRVGRALALALAEHGADVVVHYNTSAGPAEEVVEQIRGMGRRAVALGADLRKVAEATALVERAVQALGQVDILVNSASVFGRADLFATTEAIWNEHIDVNLRAPFFLSQAFARQVGERQGCQIINITDWRARRPGKAYAAYILTKAALETLTGVLALTLAPQVRVNAIAPGAILAPVHGDGEYFRVLAQRLPLRRTGSPEVVVQAMLYLLSADFVTGETVTVDGGEHL